MPRVTVPDKATGDVFTEQMWDAFIRDNFNIGSWTPIGDTIAGGAVANISFTSIPQTFAHLTAIYQARSDNLTNTRAITVRCNADSGNNYDYYSALCACNSVLTFTGSEVFADVWMRVGGLSGGNAVANTASCGIVHIPYYTGTTFHKSGAHLNGYKGTASAGNIFNEFGHPHWRNTAPITQLTFYPDLGNFVAGSRITLYGVPYI